MCRRSVKQFMAVFSIGVVAACFVPVQAQETEAKGQSAETVTVPAKTIEQLQQHLADLEVEVQQLKSQMNDMQSTMSTSKGAAGAAGDPAHSTADSVAPGALSSQTNAVLSADDRGVLDYLKGTTINASIDGYYDWNFNRPVGRVNLLRAYDVSSNAFSLNQAAVILEHAPDVAAGRRFGARLDLQFGQATSTLQGNPSNEPRPSIYRNIFQAYGTYACQSAAASPWISVSGPARWARKAITANFK